MNSTLHTVEKFKVSHKIQYWENQTLINLKENIEEHMHLKMVEQNC